MNSNAAPPRSLRATGASGGGAANPSTSTASSQQRHKTTTLIPSWSRALSSQGLAIECQKVNHPVRSSTAIIGTRECVAVLEMEVMKFVAYCGGVTLQFRIDECSPTSSQTPTSVHPPTFAQWGLASTRPCPALQQMMDPPPSSDGPSSSSHGPASAPGSSLPGSPLPPSILQVDSASRKPLHVVCAPPPSSVPPQSLSQGDIVTIDLVPKEDRQPSIIATLSLNGTVVQQRSLPCDKINSLQLYPFLILPPGALASLHKAVTPSPLFTWFLPTSPVTNGGGVLPAPESQLAELDTCFRYTTLPPSNDPAVLPLAPGIATGPPGDLLGAISFASGRHRWTMQLDNYSSTAPTHIFVGVLGSLSSPHQAPTIPSSEGVTGSFGSLQGAGSSSSSPPHMCSPGDLMPSGLIPQLEADRMSPPSLRSPSPALDASEDDANQPDAAASKWPPKWGVWVKLPPAGTPGANPPEQPCPSPPADPPGCRSHLTTSSSAHCFITVDLDMDAGLLRFFRNGHLVGSAFQAIRGPVTPLLSFVQAPTVACQAGEFNLTKIDQMDLGWNPDKCSGDLRLNGPSVQKVAEIYGDYSTVLASKGFISGVHLWMVKIGHLSEPDSIFIGVCRGCMPLDQDPQDLRDRTYYLSNGVIRVAGRRVATNAANFTKGDIVGVVLDADQGEVVFFRNGVEQGRAKGIRGRLYPFVSCDSEADQVVLMGCYTLQMARLPRQLADMEWDTLGHAADVELSPNCLTATKTCLALPLSQSLESGGAPSTVRGSILYNGPGIHQFHVILDSVGPDGVWVGAVPPAFTASEAEATAGCIAGDRGFGWALHSDGDKRFDGREEEFAPAFKNGDVMTVTMDTRLRTISFSKNGQVLGEAFTSVSFPLVAAVTLASEESRVTIQNRPTVMNTGEYTGELRWDEARSGKDLHVVDGLTVTKVANEGGDYATVLGTLCLASGQHAWNIYINHVEDSNIFIGCSVGGHDLNSDPQEMKHRTYYLSNGTIRVAGKLVTRCAEPYAEGDVVTVQLDMEQHHVAFLKNGSLQGAGDGLPEEIWPYVSLDNVMDSLTLHSSSMFIDLAQSLRWNQARVGKQACLSVEGEKASLRGPSSEHPHGSSHEVTGQATVLGLREYKRQEAHTWIVRFHQPPPSSSQGSYLVHPWSNFLVGVAPPGMDLNRSLGEEGCGIAVDYYGYFYVNGRYFHSSNLSNWSSVAKIVKGSTAKHKGKASPAFTFNEEGVCDVTITLDLKEGTLRFTHNGRNIGTIASVKGPLHAAATLTSSRQSAMLLPGPIGTNEQTSEELVNVLRAKGLTLSPRLEAALLVVPRDVFLPRDRQREAFRDNKVAIRMQDASTLTLPPPSFVARALEKLALQPGESFLDVGCGSGYVTALAACLVMPSPMIKGRPAPSSASSAPQEANGSKQGLCYGLECIGSRLEHARGNLKILRDKISAIHSAAATSSSSGPSTSQGTFTGPAITGGSILPSTLALASTVLGGDPLKALQAIELALSNVLAPECTAGVTFDALYCDAAASEDDLPMLLSLLKPGGRMILVIDEEAVLITKGSRSSSSDGPKIVPTSLSPSLHPHHDFSRENIEGLTLNGAAGSGSGGGEFGVLEDPTPWQVQDAIREIKARERKLGQEQTRQEVSSQRSYEYLEMQQRVQGAMQRIVELERILEAQARSVPGSTHSSARASPLRSSLPTHPMDGIGGQAPAQPTVSFSPWASPIRSTPINSPRLTPQGSASITPVDDVKAVARDTSSAHGQYYRGQHAFSPRTGTVRTRGGPLFRGPSQPARGGGGSSGSLVPGSPVSENDKDQAGIEFVEPSTPGSMVNFATSALFSGEVSMPQQAFDDIIDSLSVQTFTTEQIQSMIAAAGDESRPMQVESREVFPGIFKGVKVRVWKASIGQQLGYLELKTAYSRYCVAHPNICAVLGVCIEEEASDDVTADREDSVFEEAEDDVRDNESMTDGLYSMSSRETTKARSATRNRARHRLWVVEESFGEESLFSRLERGLLSWQQVARIATDICKSLAFLQDMRLAAAATNGTGGEDTAGLDPPSDAAVLSEYALRTVVSPSNVQVDSRSNKVSVLPALLNHLETSLGDGSENGSQSAVATMMMMTAINSNMAYIDPNSLFSSDKSSSSSSKYFAFGVVLLQLVCEQGPLGLISAVREAIQSDSTSMASSPSSLLALIPRLPVSSEIQSWATEYCLLALRLTEPGGINNLESEVLPKLESLSSRLSSISGINKAMSWEQVEEVLMLPLQPKAAHGSTSHGGAGGGGGGARRWVRSDFRQRRKLFLDEVAKLAVDGPIHKMEIRRARCFKDSVHVFTGKGHAVWKQPLKITFAGEAGMDNGGVTREWFSALSTAIARNSPDLFWNVGSQKNQMYISPLSNSPSHLKKFHFVGLFMAKAILETAARSRELGTITLAGLNLCEPFWKLLLGIPLNLMDLQLLDPTEFRSLMSLLDMDIDGIIFENFVWTFHHSNLPGPSTLTTGANAAASLPAWDLPEPSTPTSLFQASSAANTPNSAAGAGGSNVFAPNSDEGSTSIPLKPGGSHIRVTNPTKREYVLLKAHKMLVGTVESQMSAIIDAFHSLIPRDLLDKYNFTSMEMQLLVCGEQRVDILDLKRSCRYEDGYNGSEEVIGWFWEAAEAFDEAHRRQLLQFWSGSDGMPAEGFGSLDPPFHMVAVDRIYDANDTTARLPAAHTCFRQLDLPRYKSLEETREKLITAITIGQGYMGIS